MYKEKTNTRNSQASRMTGLEKLYCELHDYNEFTVKSFR